MKIKRVFNLILFIIVLSNCGGGSYTDLKLIPEPQFVKNLHSNLLLDYDIGIEIQSQEWVDLKKVLYSGLTKLSGKPISPGETTNIIIKNAEELDSLAFHIEIGNQIVVHAGSYSSASMAISTLLQLVEFTKNKLVFPQLFIEDKPENEYQGLMVDVARKPHSIATLKQIVDICFFYKIRFIQIHLSDDQAFTFPSDAYPKLATPGHSFTKQELKELVEYSKQRGIIIIPEFDLPGHSTAMRKAMPELFGAHDLYAINLASEEVWDAIYTISKEMMDLFYTSPYFHIGADEAYLEPMGNLPEVKKLIKTRGYDNVHDLFLEFIVTMNDFIRANGKTTMVWESFQGKGSKHVEVPNDIIVFAWETLYQQPQSLIDNGYTIINASWKPLYITPWARWDQEAILNWNPAKWENHWKITPSYNGLQIDTSDAIIGTQVCSWEMTDQMQVPDIKYRLPALAAKTWSLWRNAPEDFKERYKYLDPKLDRILFPVEIKTHGLTEPNYQGVEWNKQNYFTDKMSIDFSIPKDWPVYYTLNGNIPTSEDQMWKQELELTTTTHLKAIVLDKYGSQLGYLNRVYELHPIEIAINGEYSYPRDINITKPTVVLDDSVEVTLHSTNNAAIRYSLTGDVTPDSEVITNPIYVNTTVELNAAIFDKDGQVLGEKFKIHFFKHDEETTITTHKKVSCSSESSYYKAKNAVDGIVVRDGLWGADGPAPQWLTVDLDKIVPIETIKLYTYWDGTRYYQYTIEVSEDSLNWQQVVDFSKNKIVASSSGITHNISKKEARYIKTTMLHNSANPGLHISEIRAY